MEPSPAASAPPKKFFNEFDALIAAVGLAKIDWHQSTTDFSPLFVTAIFSAKNMLTWQKFIRP
jgi:hypothetical protein